MAGRLAWPAATAAAVGRRGRPGPEWARLQYGGRFVAVSGKRPAPPAGCPTDRPRSCR